MNYMRAMAVSAVVAIGAAGGAGAGTVNVLFDLTGGAGLQDSLAFSQGGLNLTVTGHLLNSDGSVGSLEKVGQYSNGLGVTNDDEITVRNERVCTGNGNSRRCEWKPVTYLTDEHFVDGYGKDEVLKFSFDKAVEIHTVWFSYNDSREDFAFTVLDGAKAGTFFPEVDIPGSAFYGSYTFSKQWIASMFGIGAVGPDDAFKVKKIEVKYNEPVTAVPLPAAGWLLLAGLGGIAAMKRRAKAA